MSFQLLPTLCLFSLLCHSSTSKAKWEYDETDNNISHWVEHYPECGSNRQSPIDVLIQDVTSTEYPFECAEPLLLQFASETEHFAIRNNGHSLQAIPMLIEHEGGSEISGLEVLHHTNDTHIRLTNSFYNTFKSTVNKEYCFTSLHFHWGETNEYGSEHALNGELYPLELHLVHYSCDYRMARDAQKAYSSGSATDKYDDDNVLAVIGVLFEIGEANPVLDNILDDFVVNAVRFYNDEFEYENVIELYYTDFDLMDLLPENKEFIGYKGSLTTPPCYETVRWHVMKDTMTVSLEQMVKFRMILESTDVDDTMAPNWRPLQDIGDRILYQCQETVDAEAIIKHQNEEEIMTTEDLQVEYEETEHVILVDQTVVDHDHPEDEEHADDHGFEDVIYLEIEGASTNILWAMIGVAFIVICYLTYLIHCKSEKRSEGTMHHTRHASGSDEDFMDTDDDTDGIDI